MVVSVISRMSAEAGTRWRRSVVRTTSMNPGSSRLEDDTFTDIAMRLPAPRQTAHCDERLVEHEACQRSHQAGLLGERKELERRDQTEARMRPAHQCLGGDDLAVAEVHLRLVMQDETLTLHGGAQLLDQCETVAAVID